MQSVFLFYFAQVFFFASYSLLCRDLVYIYKIQKDFFLSMQNSDFNITKEEVAEFNPPLNWNVCDF